jgi:hypothetical protein
MSKHQHLPHQPEHPDEWHAHTPAEGLPQEEHAAKANPVVLAGSLVASLVFLVVVVLVIFMYFETYVNRLRIERVEDTVLSKDQRQYKLVVSETFRDYSMLPPQYAPQGVVTIPLEQAKQRVMQRYAANLPAPAPQAQPQNSQPTPPPPPPGEPSH